LSTRTRILLAALVAAVLPLALLAAGARETVRERFTAQFRERVAETADGVQRTIAQRAADLDARLIAIEQRARRDGAARAALTGVTDRAGLIDFAPDAAAAAALDFLLLIDDAGGVLSSGHFRNDYGRAIRSLLALEPGSTAIVRARRPSDTFVVLARAHRFEVGGRRYLLVAGTEVDAALLRTLAPSAAAPVSLQLRLPDTAIGSASAATGDVARRIDMTFVDADTDTFGDAGATWIIAHSAEPLRTLLRALDRWFAAALAAALLLAFVVARVLATRVNRPLEELARQASRVRMDRSDVRFATRRRDEVGALARVLDDMVQRLRAGALQLRDAERRATVGDMARQVNHDIRNGLLPIRNVIRHLGEVAASPEELATVFGERRQTLDGGIGYLESLATNYARLTPRLDRQICSVDDIVTAVLRDARGADRIAHEAAAGTARVHADPVALRRIIDNLIVNAVESLPAEGGRVVVRTAASTETVTIAVQDSGAGMTPDTVERIFDDFFTTKERGTGLGLSIVRRLVADMGGRIAVASEPGQGTTFTIELPSARTS
jgi:signal transduction histidine kinase